MKINKYREKDRSVFSISNDYISQRFQFSLMCIIISRRLFMKYYLRSICKLRIEMSRDLRNGMRWDRMG